MNSSENDMRTTNVLKLIKNISDYGGNDMRKMPALKSSSTIRANQMGEALESFVRNGFCNSYSERSHEKRIIKHSNYFSYLGNQNNPPDIVIRDGDAIEVKKIDGVKKAYLALNSSYPKSKLYSNNPLITASCRNCEEWEEKDMVYIVGFVEKQKLKVLFIVYGDCYAASKEIYEKVRDSVSNGLKSLNLELSKTRELGRVNRVDPLGITNLRIRGMWGIKNPLEVFSDLIDIDSKDKLTVFALMRKTKFESFSRSDRNMLKSLRRCAIKRVKIQEPNNPAMLSDAVFVKMVIN